MSGYKAPWRSESEKPSCKRYEAGHYLGQHTKTWTGETNFSDPILNEAEASLLGLKMQGAPKADLWTHAIDQLLKAK